jgi:uncharacterized membrane protein
MKIWKTYQLEILIGIILLFSINVLITRDAFSNLSYIILGIGLLHFLLMITNVFFNKRK